METVPSAVDTATDAHMGGERLHAGIQPGKHDRPPRSVSSVEEQQHDTLHVACATHARSTQSRQVIPTMSLRVCAFTRCPKLVQPNERYCNEHKRLISKARGTTTQRGYGHQHQKLRHEWEIRIAHGAQPTCPRCHQPIRFGQPWQLDHNRQRTGWLGPSHTRCNEQAGQTNSMTMREHWQH